MWLIEWLDVTGHQSEWGHDATRLPVWETLALKLEDVNLSGLDCLRVWTSQIRKEGDFGDFIDIPKSLIVQKTKLRKK